MFLRNSYQNSKDLPEGAKNILGDYYLHGKDVLFNPVYLYRQGKNFLESLYPLSFNFAGGVLRFT